MLVASDGGCGGVLQERGTFLVELGVHAWPRSLGTVRRLQVWPRLHNTPVSAQSAHPPSPKSACKEGVLGDVPGPGDTPH